MKKIAIIAAMAEEVTLLKTQLTNPTTQTIAGIEFLAGQLAGQSVVLARSGIGKVNAAITTSLLADHFGCDLVINTGSAAGVQPHLSIGDVVVASEVAHHDVDLTFFNYTLGQLPEMPATFIADTELSHALTNFTDPAFTHQISCGLIVTGDRFVTDSHTITQHFPATYAIEMEAAAIAQTCHRFELPFVIIRSISDTGDEQAHVSFTEFLPIAADNSARLVMGLLGLV